MNKTPLLKNIASLFLALTMLIALSVTALPVSAAGGNIYVKFNPDVPLEKTTFRLYQVGEFGHDSAGKSIIVPYGDFASCGIDLNDIEIPETPDKEWIEKWLAKASDLENWILTSGASVSPDWTGELVNQEARQLVGDGSQNNGIYLLVGEERLIDQTYWAPVPVLIMVLNGDTDFDLSDTDLKVKSRSIADKHIVTKLWQDTEYDAGRPTSVKVGIYCGSNLVDTVELSGANNWSYTWFTTNYDSLVYTSKDPDVPGSQGVTTEKLNADNDFKLDLGDMQGSWRVDEIVSGQSLYTRSIKVTGSDDGKTEYFSITNTLLTPVIHNPPVLKTVKGDEPDEDEMFEFRLKAVSTTANIEMPMPSGSDGKTKTIQTKAGTPKEFGDIIFRAPGEYYYEISEVDTGLDGYKYDTSIYSLHYTLTVDGTKLDMKLTTSKNGKAVDIAQYEFVNEYTDEDVPGGSKKIKTGDDTNLILPVAAFAGALILLVILIIKRKKK